MPQRYLVWVLVTLGTPIEIIARYVAEDGGIHERTLKKHFADEIATGRDWVIAGLGVSVIRAGLGGDWPPHLSAYLARFGPPGWKLTQSGDAPAAVGSTRIIIEGGLPHRSYTDEGGRSGGRRSNRRR